MKTWKRINSYLEQYWIREVLGKFPVMQHLRFGTIFPLSWEPSRDLDRRQLEYVAPPKVPSSPIPIDCRQGRQSHMANGLLDEFTSIQRNN